MKLRNILIALVAVIVCSLPAHAIFDKYSIDRDDLPVKAQEFIKEHFPKARVSMVKTDKHLLRKADYDVKLVNGTKLEFNSSGAWTSVNCQTREVPSKLVLKPIRNYIAKNFPETFVVKIEKKTFGFEIELNDGVELKFDRLGTFKSMKME